MRQRQGIFGAMRERLFGHTDEIAAQLHEIERQGRGMARLAHVAAFALVIAFSAGSLVALSGEALARLVAQWRAGGVDVPAAISLAVSVLLVVAMDVALVVAAANIRMLRQRHQEGVGLHVAVIIGVSLVEAATFGYMLVTYDTPTSWAVWLLIAARSLSAPLTAVYLSLARTLPVGARDILAQVELATGRGVIRDMVTVAGDPDAPLQRKLELYRAASVMAPADAAKLDALIAATTTPEGRQVAQSAQTGVDDTAHGEATSRLPGAAQEAQGAAQTVVADTLVAQDAPPAATTPDGGPPDGSDSPPLGTKLGRSTRRAGGAGSGSAGNVTPLRRDGMGRRPKQSRKAASRANARSGKRGQAQARVFAVLAEDPGVSFDTLCERAKVAPSTGSKWLAVWQAQQTAEQWLAR